MKFNCFNLIKLLIAKANYLRLFTIGDKIKFIASNYYFIKEKMKNINFNNKVYIVKKYVNKLIVVTSISY